MKKKLKITVLLMLSILLLAMLPAFSEEAKDPSIVHFWPMDESYEDVLSGLNFYSDSDDFTDGAYAGSSAWDATNRGHGYTDPVSSGVQSFTVSLWFLSPSDNTVPWNALFSAGNLKNSDFIELYLSNGVDESGLALRGSVGNQVDLIVAHDVSPDEWHHYVLTYDAETKMLSGYIDGKLGAEKNVSAGNFSGLNETVLYLGHEKTNYVFGYTYIDDVIFAERAFSAEEISKIYADPAGFASKYLPEPVATKEPEITPEPTENSGVNDPTAEATAVPATEKAAEATAVPGATDNKSADETGKVNAMPFIIAAIAVVAVVAIIVILAVLKKKKK